MAAVHIQVRQLEIARAHDGLFRGAPEPVVLIALYSVGGEQVRLLRRERLAFKTQPPYPATVEWSGKGWSDDAPDADRFIIVAIGLEEDGGDDIQRIQDSLVASDDLLVWKLDSEDPERLPLAALTRQVEWDVPHRCELENKTGAFSTSCSWDKWIGASAWVVDASHEKTEHHVHMRSPLRRNDWTLRLESSAE